MEKQYKILILIAQKQIQAVSVDDKGRTEPISINGNVRMSYNSSDDLNELITSIKDTYNIDSFSDLVFSVFVVNFDAGIKILKQLCAMLDGAKDLNVVNAAFILPFASGKKEKFKKDENRTAQILESDYYICLNEDFSIVCEKATSGADENTQILVAEDFAFIFNLNAKDFGLLEEEIKAEVAEETLQEQQSNIPEEKTEQILEKGSLPMVVENQPPAVTENKIGKMIFVEGGNISESFQQYFKPLKIGDTYSYYDFTDQIQDFYISSTPVTVQEYYDVMGSLPEKLLFKLLRDSGYTTLESLLKINHRESLSGLNETELERAFCELGYTISSRAGIIPDGIKNLAVFTNESFIPAAEAKFYEDCRINIIMPKSVLDRVDKSLLSKCNFIEQEEFMRKLISDYGCAKPVTNISAKEISDFCDKKSEAEGLESVYRGTTPINSKTGYRLPTAREWLYAALGGINHNDFQYSGSDTLSEVGWYDENSHSSLPCVANQQPNTLGLYDMSGLIKEWTQVYSIDHYDNYIFGGSYKDSYDKSALSRIVKNAEKGDIYHTIAEDIGFRVCRLLTADEQQFIYL